MDDLVKLEIAPGRVRLYFANGREAEEHLVPIRHLPKLMARLMADALALIDHHEATLDIASVERVLRGAARDE